MLRVGACGPGLVVLTLVVLGCLALPIDEAVARFVLKDSLPGELRSIFRRAELFGHAYGILAIGITIYVLDPKRRKFLPRLAATCLAAGLSADFLKVMFWRTRPRTFELLERGESSWFGSIWTTESWTWDILFDSSRHSFPSAHTATAVAMAMLLSKLYPAGKIWFVVLAALCAANRIDGGAHFVSDVCWGAALGMMVVIGMYRSQRVNQCFARWEQPNEPARHVLPMTNRKSA